MDPNPVKVVVGSEDLSANHDVMQIVEVLDDRSRDARLVTLLEKYHKSQKNRVLVFVLYKKEAYVLKICSKKRGWKVKFGTWRQSSTGSHLLSGLDIPKWLSTTVSLLRRKIAGQIGRTGRAGKKGVAHTFFMQENKGLAGELVNVLREAGQLVPTDLMKFGTHVKKKESKLYGAHFKEISADAPKSKKITFNDSDGED
ncbi:hypothetical protein IFM89_000442 [Coptis chinensis]|uniref:Helicase C-terminal domain-containing protein n=1 Tax=Coptis chinensis TaxID=261450 RepID=A0A835LYS6_9MAGN|nr:hypothetical protein IFM89_000442 [Coptis chinensis]